MRSFLTGILLLALFPSFSTMVYAQEVRCTVTVLYASSEGADFDLDNDAYRDKLIELFSYTYYEQKDQVLLMLSEENPQGVALPGGYEFRLALQEQTQDKVVVRARIQKNGVSYVDTSLMLTRPGVVFMGGPPLDQGVLILVLETSL